MDLVKGRSVPNAAGGGPKSQKFCGRHIWTPPKIIVSSILDYVTYFYLPGGQRPKRRGRRRREGRER